MLHKKAGFKACFFRIFPSGIINLSQWLFLLLQLKLVDDAVAGFHEALVEKIAQDTKGDDDEAKKKEHLQTLFRAAPAVIDGGSIRSDEC